MLNNQNSNETAMNIEFIGIGENPQNPVPSIEISNIDSSNGEEVKIENIKFSYWDASGTETLSFERPEAELNIFDTQYYIDSNPDIAQDISSKYQGVIPEFTLDEANLPNIVESTRSVNDGSTLTFNYINPIVDKFTGAIENYVTTGATEGRDPSPLFDSGYYLEQNPDIASALVGGDFSGDPLLHYVSSGAAEGRDPNAYFDSDYYLAQNPGVADAGFNPLEHYVLFGSSEGRDPSPNFDPEFYLSQNPDVAAAGIDPLTHFLTAGQDEGRLPMAG